MNAQFPSLAIACSICRDSSGMPPTLLGPSRARGCRRVAAQESVGVHKGSTGQQDVQRPAGCASGERLTPRLAGPVQARSPLPGHERVQGCTQARVDHGNAS